MGLFDEVAGAVRGAVLQGTEGGAQGILNNVLGNSSLGGLSGLLGQLQSSGLGDLVSSWTGDGQGQPISMDQLKSALTPEHIQEIARRWACRRTVPWRIWLNICRCWRATGPDPERDFAGKTGSLCKAGLFSL